MFLCALFMFLCALFMCFVFEVQCIKQVAKLVVLPPVVMGYDDIDNHEFIISDEENTPDEIKRPVVTNVFEREVKYSPGTKITTRKILLTTLSPEKYKTSLTDKDTKMSPPDSPANSDSYDDSTLPATKMKEELDKSPPSLEQDKTPQKELHVDSEETQKSDSIKSDDIIAKSELLSSTLPITEEKEVMDNTPPSHEQDVTSQEELHADNKETQEGDDIKSDDDLANSEFITSTSPITKEKEKVVTSPPPHEQVVTSQEELHVEDKETQEGDDIKSDDDLANSELITSTSPITKEKEEVVISPPSHEQGITSQGQFHVDKETFFFVSLGDTKKEDKVQKEDPDDDEDHKKTLHSSVSTESEKPVPVARNYLVNGFI